VGWQLAGVPASKSCTTKKARNHTGRSGDAAFSGAKCPATVGVVIWVSLSEGWAFWRSLPEVLCTALALVISIYNHTEHGSGIL
jgi:hypothetical protein